MQCVQSASEPVCSRVVMRDTEPHLQQCELMHGHERHSSSVNSHEVMGDTEPHPKQSELSHGETFAAASEASGKPHSAPHNT